jgi:hypothetical protein
MVNDKQDRIIYLFILVRLVFELRVLHLQSRHSAACTTPPANFALVILEMGVSGTISLGWSHTTILLISASQITRITGISHWCLLKMEFLKCVWP